MPSREDGRASERHRSPGTRRSPGGLRTTCTSLRGLLVPGEGEAYHLATCIPGHPSTLRESLGCPGPAALLDIAADHAPYFALGIRNKFGYRRCELQGRWTRSPRELEIFEIKRARFAGLWRVTSGIRFESFSARCISRFPRCIVPPFGSLTLIPRMTLRTVG